MSSLDNYIAYTTVVAETTQKSAETVGESFKTLYARFGKIAAGKFETSQTELDEMGVSAEDMTDLNEIEQVLKAVGITLRDTPESFKNVDDVLQEIASKWDTFSDVQKSGISTAVAGTRQRENFLVLMENWENVAKYAEIAANSYGTAVEKMEAYSDGVEAARKRVQSAWEGFALIINESGVLETAFNALATAIENLHWVILSIIGALAITKPAEVMQTLTGGLTKLSLFLSDTAFDKRFARASWANRNNDDVVNTRNYVSQMRQEANEAAFVAQKQSYFADFLGKFKGGMDSTQFGGIINFQNSLIDLDKEKSLKVMKPIQALLSGAKGDALEASMQALTENIDNGTAFGVLNTVASETATELVKSKIETTKSYNSVNGLRLSQEELQDSMAVEARARKLVAMDLLEDIAKHTDADGNYTGSKYTQE